MEDKCENLLNIVVESRKRFGLKSLEYAHKTSVMDNKILNYQIETFSNYKFKPKHPVPDFEKDDLKELEDFSLEILERSKRIEALRERVKNTQEVVMQLKADSVGRRLREPLTAHALLEKAKDKNFT